MTRRPVDHTAAIESARANLDRLEERRLAALDGAGRAPDPKVIRAAEAALEAAEAAADAAQRMASKAVAA